LHIYTPLFIHTLCRVKVKTKSKYINVELQRKGILAKCWCAPLNNSLDKIAVLWENSPHAADFAVLVDRKRKTCNGAVGRRGGGDNVVKV